MQFAIGIGAITGGVGGVFFQLACGGVAIEHLQAIINVMNYTNMTINPCLDRCYIVYISFISMAIVVLKLEKNSKLIYTMIGISMLLLVFYINLGYQIMHLGYMTGYSKNFCSLVSPFKC